MLLLSVLVHDADSVAVRSLAKLGVSAKAVEGALVDGLQHRAVAAKIDPQALAALGIDFEVVREEL